METIQEAIEATEAEVEIPEDVTVEVSKAKLQLTETLIDTVAERSAYWFGKKATQMEMSSATEVERRNNRKLGKKINAQIGVYLLNGTDVREGVNTLKDEQEQVRATLKEKRKPFNEKLRPLRKAIAYLDEISIPEQLEKVTGEILKPRFQVADYTLKAIAKPKASK